MEWDHGKGWEEREGDGRGGVGAEVDWVAEGASGEMVQRHFLWRQKVSFFLRYHFSIQEITALVNFSIGRLLLWLHLELGKEEEEEEEESLISSFLNK